MLYLLFNDAALKCEKRSSLFTRVTVLKVGTRTPKITFKKLVSTPVALHSVL